MNLRILSICSKNAPLDLSDRISRMLLDIDLLPRNYILCDMHILHLVISRRWEEMSKVYLYLDNKLLSYGFPSHPLSNRRYEVFLSKIRESSLLSNKEIEVTENYPCKEEYLRYFHDDEYIEYVKLMSEEGCGFLDYGDTPAYQGIFEVSLRSVCATLDAAMKTYREKVYGVNLAGGWHHAKRDRASGFCVFNDIGVAINHLLDIERVKNIYYIDIDAHHGDGVYYSFVEDPRVYIFDVHESGYYLYPGTGFEDETGEKGAKGTKRNKEVPPEGGDDYLLNYIDEAYRWGLEIKPEIIILQGGMDGLAGDPLTHLRYSAEGYLNAIKSIFKLREELDTGLVYLGGGGYQVETQSTLWMEVLKLMLNI